jgi:hypothetical protein
MRSMIMAGALLAVGALSGCGASVVASLDQNAVPTATSGQAHVVAGTMTNGSVTTVTDRTSNGTPASATIFMAEVPFVGIEVPTSASAGFSGQTDGGLLIPATGRMAAPSSLADKAIAGQDISADIENLKYSDSDSFLQLVGTGNGFAMVKYEAQQGSTGYLGYVVAGLDGTKSTDAQIAAQTGTATFNGKASATWFASGTGKADATGDATVTATFAPGGGTAGGAISNIAVAGVAQPGLSVVLAPAAIAGSAYNGAATMTGAAASNGNFQGQFFNPDVNGTAGTFHLRATGVTTSAGVQDVEAVGAFGGNR